MDEVNDAMGEGLDKAKSLKDKAAEAKEALAGGADKAKDAAGGAADKVKGAAPDMPGGGDMPDMPDAGGVSGKAAGVAGGAAAAAGGLAGKAKGMADKAKDAAGGAADKAKGAASGATDKAKGAAAGVAGAGTAAASSVTSSTTTTTTATTTTSSGGGSGGSSSGGSGSGGSGGSSGGSGGNDDDEDKLFGFLPISGEWQIIGAGLLVFAALFFGSQILGFFGGDDADVVDAVALEDVTDPRCITAVENLEGSGLDPDVIADVSCGIDSNGEIVLSGEIPDEGNRAAITAAAAGVGASALAIDGADLFVVEEEVEEVEEVAAPETTTTTAAPETTTTTAAPETTTTTAAPETTTTTAAPEPFTMWDALNESGEAQQFAGVGAALGLQEFLEEIEDEDGNTVMRTLFAPSDAALAALGQEAIGEIANDQAAANALVGYHVLDEPLLAADLVALDGESIDTSVGLPLAIGTDDGGVVLNGTSLVTVTDLVADNGVVHIVDVVLMPPTINQILDLENIEFEVNLATITAAGQETLQLAVAFFTENPGVNAVIEGHTDTDGTDEVNLELSQARAQSVVDFLVANGLEESRFTPRGFGESQPILVDGVEDKAASRRIEFVAQ